MTSICVSPDPHYVVRTILHFNVTLTSLVNGLFKLNAVEQCQVQIYASIEEKKSYYSESTSVLEWNTSRPWRILLELLPIFLFFFSPVVILLFFFTHLFFSIMLALILKISHQCMLVNA